jgi:hypothetical protein
MNDYSGIMQLKYFDLKVAKKIRIIPGGELGKVKEIVAREYL